MIKRIVYIIVSVLLLAFCIASSQSDDRLIGKSEEAAKKYGGLYTDGKNIISVYAYHGKQNFLDNLDAVTRLASESEVPVYVAIPPRKMDVITLPDDIDTAPHLALFDLAQSNCTKAGAQYIDLLTVLKGSGLYFSSDHHWTSRGAFLAYEKIAEALGAEPHAESYFTVETVHTSYRGSDWGKSDKTLEIYDSIELYYSPDYTDYTATIVNYPFDSDEGNEIIGGMYHIDSLTSWDPYTVYLTGNKPYITIRNGEDRETLLIVRDSFASALAPFLALHFDIVMIDPRFYPDRLSSLVEREGIGKILVLENMGSFTENTVKFSY